MPSRAWHDVAHNRMAAAKDGGSGTFRKQIPERRRRLCCAVSTLKFTHDLSSHATHAGVIDVVPRNHCIGHAELHLALRSVRLWPGRIAEKRAHGHHPVELGCQFRVTPALQAICSGSHAGSAPSKQEPGHQQTSARQQNLTGIREIPEGGNGSRKQQEQAGQQSKPADKQDEPDKQQSGVQKITNKTTVRIRDDSRCSRLGEMRKQAEILLSTSNIDRNVST